MEERGDGVLINIKSNFNFFKSKDNTIFESLEVFLQHVLMIYVPILIVQIYF